MAEFVPLIFVQGGVSGNGSDHEIETPADFQNHLEQLQTGVNQKKQGASMVLVEQFRERKTPRNA